MNEERRGGKNQNSPCKPQEKKVSVSTSRSKKVAQRKLWEILVLKITQNFSVLPNQVPREKINVVMMSSNDSCLPPTCLQLKLASYIYFVFKRVCTAAGASSKNTAYNCSIYSQ